MDRIIEITKQLLDFLDQIGATAHQKTVALELAKTFNYYAVKTSTEKPLETSQSAQP
jgi:5'(3')-deoxyribonucleotidase